MGDAQQPVGRDVPLVNIFNLRDLGGYATVDGRRVRGGRLYRGAGLQRLAGVDMETVRNLRLTTFVDLRTNGELELNGTAPAELLGAEFHHLPMIGRIWDPVGCDPERPPEEYLLDRYREMLDEGAPTIVAATEIFSQPDNLPGVFYCAAGKDRTGVLAALILDAIGVEPEAIVADYHLSKERVDRIRARALASREESTMVAQPLAFMQAPAGAMRLLLAWLRQTYGATAGYLQEIGVGAGTISSLTHLLLEST